MRQSGDLKCEYLLGLVGVEPPGTELDGVDLSGAFRGEARRRGKALFWEYGRTPSYCYPGLASDRSPNLAMRVESWKLLVNDDGSRVELYDLASDRAERENLASREKERAQRMVAELLAWRRALPSFSAK